MSAISGVLSPSDRRSPGRIARPGRRTRGFAGAVLGACVLAPWGATDGQTPQADRRPTVAAMPYFNNGAVGPNRAEYDALGKGIADVLITELAGNPTIRVLERDRVQQLMDEQNLGSAGRIDQETAVKVGKLLGVHHMIFGGFIVDQRGTMRLDARAVNVETSVVEHVESVTDKADNLLAILSTLAGKLNNGMKLPAMPAGSVRPAVSPEATKPGRWRTYGRAATRCWRGSFGTSRVNGPSSTRSTACCTRTCTTRP